MYSDAPIGYEAINIGFRRYNTKPIPSNLLKTKEMLVLCFFMPKLCCNAEQTFFYTVQPLVLIPSDTLFQHISTKMIARIADSSYFANHHVIT